MLKEDKKLPPNVEESIRLAYCERVDLGSRYLGYSQKRNFGI